jgi:hypothetical protein
MNFQKGFPRRVTAVLAIIQTILAAAIIGLEFGSFSNDVAHGTIWAGFWCGVVFIITFLMMFCTSKYFTIFDLHYNYSCLFV